jgi:hypothetical protein
MPILTYLHQLFNADICHAYLHTLRWKERPLQCPRCQCHAIGPLPRGPKGENLSRVLITLIFYKQL